MLSDPGVSTWWQSPGQLFCLREHWVLPAHAPQFCAEMQEPSATGATPTHLFRSVFTRLTVSPHGLRDAGAPRGLWALMVMGHRELQLGGLQSQAAQQLHCCRWPCGLQDGHSAYRSLCPSSHLSALTHPDPLAFSSSCSTRALAAANPPDHS